MTDRSPSDSRQADDRRQGGSGGDRDQRDRSGLGRKRSNRGNVGPSRRRSARLAAVQALYQMDITGISAGSVVDEFLRERLPSSNSAREATGQSDDGDVDVCANVDRTLFSDIVRGAAAEGDLHDRMIAGALDSNRGGNRGVERLEAVLRAILRAAVFELRRNSADTPPRVVINEYIDVAHAFYGGGEPGLVNGVLDRLARVLDDGKTPRKTAVRASGDGAGRVDDDDPAAADADPA